MSAEAVPAQPASVAAESAVAASTALPWVVEYGPAPVVDPVQHVTGRVVAPACTCGNVTPGGHGEAVMPRPFNCDEILAIRARVEADPHAMRRTSWLRGWLR